MVALDIPIERSSVDQLVDRGNYGRELLKVCKDHLLCIFNGRAGNDRLLGKATTTDNTLIDYVIGSPFLISKTIAFDVNDFDNFFSDKHCRIEWKFTSNMYCPDKVTKVTQLPVNNTNGIFFDINKVPEFINNMDSEAILYLIENFDNIPIRQITDSIKHVMIKSANETFQKYRPKSNSEGKYPCYTNKARKLTREYRRVRNKNKKRRIKDVVNANILKEKSRACRKEVLKVRAISKKKVVKLLRELKAKGTTINQYWRVLKGNKREHINVPLEVFKDHFANLAVNFESNIDNLEVPPVSDNVGILDTSALNQNFTETEIRNFVKTLKNNKAAGIDGILNEFIKHTIDLMIPLYIKLFNRVLDTGDIPEDWLTGLIIPIYKNKGEKNDPNNYRGITLLSCLGKLFTSILNHRLTEFCENNLILKEIQAGFRKGYSTLDHIFVLKNLIDIFKSKNKKLFCCYVDYTKAFDSIWREALWHKLINCGIQGKILNVIKSMYAQIKSCVFLNGEKSDFFISARGVRQGENLSPLLFSLFVNDIENEFLKHGCSYINIDAHWDNFIRLLVLMYADDTIILADSKENLQLALNALKSYCDTWKLEINCTKTKITIFSSRKANTTDFNFKYGNNSIEIVDWYKYLGVILNYNGSFNLAIENLQTQASRAMFSLISRARRLRLPIDMQLELFDKTVLPILLYGCEIWGHSKAPMIETFHLSFLKMILGVHTKTCNNMVYGELGRIPIDIFIKKRIIGYWARILESKESKLTKVTYTQILNRFNTNHSKSKWIESIRNILAECNLNDIWTSQSFRSAEWLKSVVFNRLKSKFINRWSNELQRMSSCDLYVQYKTIFKFENYLVQLPPQSRFSLCRFRLNNTRLPIVLGRFTRTPRNQRFCTLCTSEEPGNELHFLFKCNNPQISSLRSDYIPTVFTEQPSIQKCVELLSTDNINVTRKLSIFLKNALKLLN